MAILKPDINAEFDACERDVLIRRYEEACQAAKFLVDDMHKISRGQVKDPAKFAKESITAASFYLIP